MSKFHIWCIVQWECGCSPSWAWSSECSPSPWSALRYWARPLYFILLLRDENVNQNIVGTYRDVGLNLFQKQQSRNSWPPSQFINTIGQKFPLPATALQPSADLHWKLSSVDLALFVLLEAECKKCFYIYDWNIFYHYLFNIHFGILSRNTDFRCSSC